MKKLIIFAFLICLACNQDVSEKLVGQWAIDEIEYNGIDYKDNLYVNFMAFEENKDIYIPESRKVAKDRNANWSWNNKKNELSIVCNDKAFEGKYSVNYIKDRKRKLLGIELKSEKTFIRAYKYYQNFDRDGIGW